MRCDIIFPLIPFEDTSLSMSKETSRMEFIQQTIASMTAFTLLPSNANAAKYGGFGAGSPEVIDPKAAIVDRVSFL